MDKQLFFYNHTHKQSVLRCVGSCITLTYPVQKWNNLQYLLLLYPCKGHYSSCSAYQIHML